MWLLLPILRGLVLRSFLRILFFTVDAVCFCSTAAPPFGGAVRSLISLNEDIDLHNCLSSGKCLVQ